MSKVNELELHNTFKAFEKVSERTQRKYSNLRSLFNEHPA
jgi:hypothetical protein